MYSVCDNLSVGFPHSEIFGSKLICQLPEAYRRLPRPSSPVIAKASTTCTYSLDPITLIPLSRTGYKSANCCRIPQITFENLDNCNRNPCLMLSFNIKHHYICFFRLLKNSSLKGICHTTKILSQMRSTVSGGG